MQDPASSPRQDALQTKNVRVSRFGDRRRNQPHPNEDDKPPGRWFLSALVSSRYLTSQHPTPLRTLHPIQQPRPFFLPLFTRVRGRQFSEVHFDVV